MRLGGVELDDDDKRRLGHDLQALTDIERKG
jgi:hypothetical protein